MRVADLMTTDVVALHPETNLASAVQTMLAQHATGLPVIDEAGQIKGILTEGDLLCRAELKTGDKEGGWFSAFFLPGRLASQFVHSHGRHVAQVMTPDPLTVMPATGLADAARLMRDKKFKQLPVVTEGRLVGMLTRADLLRALAGKLTESEAEATSESIKSTIEETLAKEKWAPRSAVQVEVAGNVVTLHGVVFSDSERQAVKVIAENTPGVKEVRDQLAFVEPASGIAFTGG